MPSLSALKGLRALALIMGWAMASPGQAADLLVAVAANFAAPMKVLAEQFERQTGHRLALSFGATGQFYAQIRHGAAFAVLLAADDEVPRRLEAEGLGVAGTRQTYATGRLVLWSAQPGLVDAQGHILRSPPPGRIALANPKLSPYGRASREVMTRLGLAAPTVEAAHIGQAYQFVASGNAPLGFLALSQVFEDGRLREGSAWIVPQALHTPIVQQALILQPGRTQPAAAALMEHLRSAQSRALIARYGYQP
jgi:molybdate transport system substrate-binding protein